MLPPPEQHRFERIAPIALEPADGQWAIVTDGIRRRVLRQLSGTNDQATATINAPQGSAFALDIPGAKARVVALSITVRRRAEAVIIVAASGPDGTVILPHPAAAQTVSDLALPRDTAPEMPTASAMRQQACEAGIRGKFVEAVCEGDALALHIMRQLLEKHFADFNPQLDATRQMSLLSQRRETLVFSETMRRLVFSPCTTREQALFQRQLRALLTRMAAEPSPVQAWIAAILQSAPPIPDFCEEPDSPKQIGVASGKAMPTFQQALARLDSGKTFAVSTALQIIETLSGASLGAQVIAGSAQERASAERILELLSLAETPRNKRPPKTPAAVIAIAHQLNSGASREEQQRLHGLRSAVASAIERAKLLEKKQPEESGS